MPCPSCGSPEGKFHLPSCPRLGDGAILLHCGDMPCIVLNGHVRDRSGGCVDTCYRSLPISERRP